MNYLYYYDLPIYNLVHHLSLFTARLLEVNAGSFDAAMSQKVCQQGDIVVLLQKVLREQMPECMRMDQARVDAVFDGEFFQAEGYPAGRESSPLAFRN